MLAALNFSTNQNIRLEVIINIKGCAVEALRNKFISETVSKMDSNKSESEISEIDDYLNEIKKKVCCRDDEIKYLIRLLGQSPSEEPPKTLFIQGDSGVGKSLIIKNILETVKYSHAIVDCVEMYSMKFFYENIINQITKHEFNTEDFDEPYAKCNSFLDFVIELQRASEKLGVGNLNDEKSLSIIIVLDGCETLRKLDKTILMSFLKLRELSKLKLGVVFLSTLPWISFLIEDNAFEPIIYYLENYNQKQIIEILKRDKPDDFSMKFYENFLSLFLSIFYQTCHDIYELKFQAKINFENYSEPVREGKLSESDAGELWKRAQPFFKKSLRTLYLRMGNELDNSEKTTSVVSQVLNMEMPFYSKYLLIASYLASYNPASEDRRLFVKNHGKIKKSKRAKSSKVKLYLLGPKTFGLQRLFAIVAAILDNDQFNLNADLFNEIASLVRMNLITQISDDVLDGPTYKCNVGLQFIDILCKNIQFPIRNYLVDFLDA